MGWRAYAIASQVGRMRSETDGVTVLAQPIGYARKIKKELTSEGKVYRSAVTLIEATRLK